MSQITQDGDVVPADALLAATTAPIVATELGVVTRPALSAVSPSSVDYTLIAHTTEGDLAVLPADARWVPIRVSYAIPANMNIVIIARIGDNSVLTMVVYDDNFDGIQPLFATKSVVTITGTLGTGRVIDIYVLPNGGWIRESVQLIPYIAHEVVA